MPLIGLLALSELRVAYVINQVLVKHLRLQFVQFLMAIAGREIVAILLRYFLQEFAVDVRVMQAQALLVLLPGEQALHLLRLLFVFLELKVTLVVLVARVQ